MRFLALSLLIVVLVTSLMGSVHSELVGPELVIKNSQLSPIVVSLVETSKLLIPINTLVLPGESLTINLPYEPAECWIGWKSLRGEYKLKVV